MTIVVKSNIILNFICKAQFLYRKLIGIAPGGKFLTELP